MLDKIKKILRPKEVKAEGKRFRCSVCAKRFTHKKPETLVGMLGIIPVQFCRICFPRVLEQSEELNLSDVQLKVVNGG